MPDKPMTDAIWFSEDVAIEHLTDESVTLAEIRLAVAEMQGKNMQPPLSELIAKWSKIIADADASWSDERSREAWPEFEARKLSERGD